MNSIEQALYTRLTGDGTLMALVSGVFRAGMAPPEQAYPFVSFQQWGDFMDAYTLKQRAWQDGHYQLKAVDRIDSDVGSLAPSATILDRIDVLLTDYALPVAGKQLLYLRRTSLTQPYPEPMAGGQQIWHSPAVYRIEVA